MKDAIKHIEHFITELLSRKCILLKSEQSLCLFLGGFYSLQCCQSKASLKFSVQDRTHTKRTFFTRERYLLLPPQEGGKFQTKVTSCRNFPQCEEYQPQSTDMFHKGPFPAVQTFPGRKLRIEASLPARIQRKLFFLLPRFSVEI